ncbi:MAG: tetratricopeptide repeat protein, partial [Abitibacteriaceae bacterium]|nr:tetratricopeptide repeat protein [Abditibacteriaceae bacterium]
LDGGANSSPNLALERAPGIAQAAAAPLRRALAHLGFTDVLNTSPDSAAIQRAVNNWRLTPHILDSLQASTARIVAVSLANPVGSAAANHVATAADETKAADTASSATATPGTTANVNGATATDITQPNESRATALKEMLQPAIASASRIGLALNYRAVIVLAVVPHAATDAGSALLVPTAASGTGQGTNTATNKSGNAALPPPSLPAKSATYALLIVDAARETGEPIVFDESGGDDLSLNETAADTGAALIEKRLNEWGPVAPTDRAQKITAHMTAARAAATKGDLVTAEDEIVQVIALDGTRAEAQVFLGDILQASDPANAAAAYRRAVDLNAKDGLTWAKIAIASTLGPQPNWPGAIEAGQNAIKLGYDTASVRTAMATAQYGRADIFRKYDRMDKAQDAEAEARQHLDRAAQLEPDNPDVARLMARQLVAQGRYSDALQSLDRLALQYPNDIGLQTQYAQVLTTYGRRDEDAFAAWANVWKLTGAQGVTLDPLQYRHISEGFDQRLDDIGRSAAQLTTSVAQGAMPRETALVQLAKLKEDMTVAVAAIKIIQPPGDRNLSLMHTSRTFAADLMDQALDAHQTYLETGQENFRVRAIELHRQSINRLNAARASRD